MKAMKCLFQRPTTPFGLQQPRCLVAHRCITAVMETNFTLTAEMVEAHITPKSKILVLINPNNPTGALMEAEALDAFVTIARSCDAFVLCDEVYDKILYEDATFTPMASLADDVLFMSFNGLSKTYRAAGFRSGWVVLSGAKHRAKDYIQGLDMLASMRLCSNVPSQYAIQTALGGYQSIKELTCEGGRLTRQRDMAWRMLDALPGVSCHKPEGALYLFPRLDPEVYAIQSDEQFAFDLLSQQKVLVVQGSGFNLPDSQHFRIVFLPYEEQLIEAVGRIATFLGTLRN